MKKKKDEKDFLATTEVEKAKEAKKVSKKKSGEKKPNIFKRIGTRLKDTFSELKKVTWNPLPKVIKQTGIVIVVVLIFLVIITAFDFGLLQLMNLIR